MDPEHREPETQRLRDHFVRIVYDAPVPRTYTTEKRTFEDGPQYLYFSVDRYEEMVRKIVLSPDYLTYSVDTSEDDDW